MKYKAFDEQRNEICNVDSVQLILKHNHIKYLLLELTDHKTIIYRKES